MNTVPEEGLFLEYLRIIGQAFMTEGEYRTN